MRCWIPACFVHRKSQWFKNCSNLVSFLLDIFQSSLKLPLDWFSQVFWWFNLQIWPQKDSETLQLIMMYQYFSRMLLFHLSILFFWGYYRFDWCSILFFGEEISHGRPNPGSPLLGGTCAAFAGTNGWSWAMPRGPEMGSYGRLIWVNYNDLTATEPWNHG